ncbi:cytochrome P450 2U1-like [Anneissia japonica]|uniref:cytochrome P450 2U1-like n=1 Tax=Anneissia japonica TaxID=1529436 RepID=UPI0014258FA9|nr:cytochrome P450 2U1-like [Anneissia japonica]
MEVVYKDLLSRINIQTVVAGFTTLLILVYFTKDLRRNLPPGPWGLPVVGILPFVGNQPQKSFMKLAEKYGSVFSAYLGTKLVVFVNDYKSMKQMFAKSGDTFNDRPKLIVIDQISHGKGIASGYLHLNLKEKRRFGMKMLRSFGMGKSSFESTIVNEIDYMKARLMQVADTKVRYDPKHIIENGVSNVTCGIVFGKRYEYDDPQFKRFLSILYANLEIVSQSGALNFIPFMRFIPGSGWNKVFRNVEMFVNEFINFELEEHARTIQVHKPRDFIDEFLKARSELESSGENVDAFDDESAIHIVAELFIAGTETTATTLKWTLLYLALNPEIQAKVHQELDSVTGRRQLPTLKDQPKLVYCEAVMMEVTRIRPAVPLGVAHCTVNDTMYKEHFIPKSTTVIPNIWAVMHDKMTWPKPEEFRPERFIDGNGKLIKYEELIPFSVGRRSCIGEQLARMELYLFFTHLLHHFQFTLPTDKSKPSTYPHVGATLTPSPYDLIITKRTC